MLRCRPRSCVLRHRLRQRPSPLCQFSNSRASRQSHETITIPCASNGSIELDIYHPSTASSLGRVAIYLLRGPILPNPAHDALNISTLNSVVGCHVVKINYRHGPTHQFPTPIHDVSAGYDWIVENLLPRRAITRVGRAEHVGKVAVCGELLGGQLATALALTECRVGEPGVVAAAVNNPILDWVELSSGNGSRAMMASLFKQRRQLFRKPEHWFDPFASPMLFFRTAGYEVLPYANAPDLSEMEQLALEERKHHLSELNYSVDTSEAEDIEYDYYDVKQRKSSRRYPSKTLGLRLPTFRITTGSELPLAAQASEFTSLLRRSFSRSELSVDIPEDMVSFEQQPGLSHWDDTEAGRERMLQAANWMASKLGEH